MPTSSRRRTPTSNRNRLPIFSSVGQRRHNLSGIAILALTGVALVALVLVLIGGLQ